ncbi:MAG: hypothetical protein MJ162_05260 [Treponema sp.]|nr:hypothetical protein [Treponema sp.]
MRKFLLIFIPVLFTSCVWSPVKDYSSVKEKTSYEKFTELNDPIILSDYVMAEFNCGSIETSRIIGSAFTVYDFENGTIKDQVYTKFDSGYAPKLQKVITSSGNVRYLSRYKYEKQLCFMSPDNNQLEFIDAAQLYGYNASEELNDIYRYKLFSKDINDSDSLTQTTLIRIFDADTNTFGKEIKIKNAYNNSISANNYMPVEKGGDGYFWFITRDRNEYPVRGKYYLNRINPETGKLEEALVTYDGVKGNEVYEWSVSKSWKHTIQYTLMDSVGDELLVKKFHFILGGEESFAEYVLVNKNTFTERPLDIGLQYVGNSGGKYWFLNNLDFIAYDITTLEKVTVPEQVSIEEGWSTKFYLKDNVIYVIQSQYNDQNEKSVVIYAFDSENLLLINKRTVEGSVLRME